MGKEETARMIRAAKLYYESGLSQDEVAKILEISRPQISRMLARAKQMGYVTITVHDPMDSLKKTEENLKQRFSLKEVRVVSAPPGDSRLIKRAVAKAAVDFLTEILEPGDELGISWGTTIHEIMRQFPERAVSNVQVVQLKGGITESTHCLYTIEVVRELAQKLGGRAVYLPVPVLVDSPEIRAALLSDRNVRKAMDLANQCNVALYSIGYPGDHSILASTGYFTPEGLEEIRQRGAVGDLCSHFLRADGSIFDPELEARTISVDLDSLSRRDYAIAVGGGESRARGILGALRGGYLNTLITDESAARKILALLEEGE